MRQTRGVPEDEEGAVQSHYSGVLFGEAWNQREMEQYDTSDKQRAQ
jgi:hypothetical protein